MAAIRLHLERARLHRLLLLAMVTVTVPWLAVSIAAFPMLAAYLAPEQAARTAVISNLVATGAQKALALGIPLREEPGMAAYLEAILRENPGIRFVAIADAQDHILQAAQVPAAGRPALALDPGGSLMRVLAAARDLGFAARALTQDGRRVGAVLVGQGSAVPDDVAKGLLLDLIGGLVVMLLLTLEATRVAIGHAITAPMAAAEALVARVAAADLTQCLVLDGATAVPELIITSNRVIRGLHDRCADMLAYAEEVREAMEDRDHVAAVAARVAAFRASVRLPAGVPQERPAMAGAAPLRFAWFLLGCGAATAACPLGHLDPAPLAALVLAAMLAAVATGWLSQDRTSRWPMPVTFGLVVLALACAQVADALLAGPALIGGALGCVGAVLWRQRAPDLIAGLLAGLLVGCGLGAVLFVAARATAPTICGSLAIAGAALIGVAMARRGQTLAARAAGSGSKPHTMPAAATRVLAGLVLGAMLTGQLGPASGPVSGPESGGDTRNALFALAGMAWLGQAAGGWLRASRSSAHIWVLPCRLCIAPLAWLLAQAAFGGAGPGGLFPTGLFPTGLFPTGLFPAGPFPPGLLPAGLLPGALGLAFLLGGMLALDEAAAWSRPPSLAGPTAAFAFAAGMLLAAWPPLPLPVMLAVCGTLPAVSALVMRGAVARPRPSPPRPSGSA